MTGKVVLVTGAAKRIGRGIALRLAREGAVVAVHYGESEAEALEVAGVCGNGAGVFRADLSKVAEIERVFSEVVERYGRLDSVVNNAARFTRIDPLEVTESDWDFIHSVNLKAVFFCCQQAGRIMKAQGGGGRIVNISSLGGIRPWAEHSHYCASKAGVIHLTRALAKAFAGFGVSVNSVAPGVIPFSDAELLRVRGLVDQTPVGRAGSAEEVADAVLYFLRASEFVTGQVIAVDGGLSQV